MALATVLDDRSASLALAAHSFDTSEARCQRRNVIDTFLRKRKTGVSARVRFGVPSLNFGVPSASSVT